MGRIVDRGSWTAVRVAKCIGIMHKGAQPQAKMNFNQSENKKESVPWLKRTIASGETFVFLIFVFNYIAVKMVRLRGRQLACGV